MAACLSPQYEIAISSAFSASTNNGAVPIAKNVMKQHVGEITQLIPLLKT